MNSEAPIPIFALYGETEDFPDLVHVEALVDRSALLDWRVPAHRHADLSQLFLIFEGHGTATLDDIEVDAGPGQFVFVPAQVVHAISFQPGTDGAIFTFPVRHLGTFGPAGQSVSHALARPFAGVVSDELKALSESLRHAIGGTGPYRNQKVLGLANALLAALAECADGVSAGAETRRGNRIERLSALVRKHMEECWSVADYADALSISSGHLSRLCRAETGTGAQAYVEGIIMDEACRYLAFTDLPVAEIGYRTGFCDPSYFSKRFRASRGVSPRMYRAGFTKGAQAPTPHR